MAFLKLVEEWDTALVSADPLGFPEYAGELGALRGESVRTGLAEGAVVIEGDFAVFGGSMGVVHGEKVVRAIDRAITLGFPVLVETRSGGARMQEGMLSLVQMPRAAAAIGRLRAAGLASVAVLHDPTMGGVFASYASLCDVVAAEAGATIGFAGPRVAEAFGALVTPGRSHTAETALAAGLVDFVGDADELAHWVAGALGLERRPLKIRPLPEGRDLDDGAGAEGSAWAEVTSARRMGRPSGIDVAAVLVDSWTELVGVDATVRAGLATVDDQRLVVIAEDRYAGSGRPTPEGYALAQRAIELASRRGLPIVTLIDTPGAEPGSESELGGIARAIAETFLALVEAPVPTVAVCVGEGGSGGALAFGVADRVLIQRHAVFSVIGVEGAAAILHRDTSRAPEVAEHLQLTSHDLVDLGLADHVVPDDVGLTVAAIAKVLTDVEVGDRLTRLDAASRRWISPPR